ncbi:MAG: asparagine synthetase B [Candidatus Cloacimonetes bacterium]|nr:asparagine synthetase B [Candidatus Cloacimonadota bacterium]
MRYILISLIMAALAASLHAEILIPMDESQTDHLKAYGVTYEALKMQLVVKWLLNYRGGSWLAPENPRLEEMCRLRGVHYERIGGGDVAAIFATVAEQNMDVVTLEKEPSIAVYAPPNVQPWDDAVLLALDYAEIEHDILWDEEVLAGRLDEYDWLHLHHEDFTGQYGKFFRSFRNAAWYIETVQTSEAVAAKLGYAKVWQLKHAVAETIREYVGNGGFLFAMCAATDSYDIALAARNVDICDAVFDGDGIDPNYAAKLDFSRCFAFENFSLITDPLVYEFSSIDASDYAQLRGAENDYFLLFDFSAKYDPVPTMLTQCHTDYVNGFLGQTTSFHTRYVKDSVIILGEAPQVDEVKYLHGNYGQGTFTFMGGHDPEDYQHRIGDPPTMLDLHKNSPGYRLILNNILFPAAEKKKLKT